MWSLLGVLLLLFLPACFLLFWSSGSKLLVQLTKRVVRFLKETNKHLVQAPVAELAIDRLIRCSLDSLWLLVRASQEESINQLPLCSSGRRLEVFRRVNVLVKYIRVNARHLQDDSIVEIPIIHASLQSSLHLRKARGENVGSQLEQS